MCAGPETVPQRRRQEVAVLMVRLAKGPVEVEGVERSRQQDVRRLREQGVCVRRAEAGWMMWTLDWFDMEIEVVEEVRDGRAVVELEGASPGSGVWGGWFSSRVAAGGAEGTGWEPVALSLGGVRR